MENIRPVDANLLIEMIEQGIRERQDKIKLGYDLSKYYSLEIQAMKSVIDAIKKLPTLDEYKDNIKIDYETAFIGCTIDCDGEPFGVSIEEEAISSLEEYFKHLSARDLMNNNRPMALAYLALKKLMKEVGNDEERND